MDLGDLAANDKDRIVRELSIPAVTAMYGVVFDDSDAALCPFHNERTPSFNWFVGDDGKHRLHCHGCGWAGDVIDFVQAREGLSFSDALGKCAEWLRAGMQAPERAARADVDFRAAVDTARVNADADPLLIAELLTARHSPIPVGWLLEQFRLGVSGPEILVPHYEAGADRPHAVKRRTGDGGKMSLSGSRLTHLYGAWRSRGCDDVLICEGESDTWLLAWLMREQRTDVFGLPRGVGSEVDKSWIELLRGKDVTLLFDADDAGRKGLRRWVKALYNEARTVRIVFLPESKDASAVPLEVLNTALSERMLVPDPETFGVVRGRAGYLRRPKATADDKPELPWVPVTEWTLKVRQRIELDEGVLWDVELPNTRRDTLSSSDLNDGRKFTKWANDRALAARPAGNDTQEILRALEYASLFVPRVRGVTMVGWHDGAFVLPDVTLGTPAYAYVAPTQDVGWADRLELERGSADGGVVPALAGLHVPAVMTPILGWVAAAPLRALCAQFPTLGVMGSAGAGKTTIMLEVLGTFGFSHGTPPTISNSTPHAVWSMVGSTNAIPVWFDEYRFGARDDGLRALDQSIRDAWNGASSMRGGIGDNKSAVHSFPALAPLVVTGESAFQEQSHAERMVIVNLTRDGRAPEALTFLRGLKRDGFGRDYLEWLLWAVHSDVLDAPPALNDRPAQALAVVAWGYRVLSFYVQQRYGRVLPAFDDTLIRAEQAAMLEDSPNISILRQLIDAPDPLTGGLVVWLQGEDVCVRVGRLHKLAEKYTDIRLPGNGKATTKWLTERFPGTHMVRNGGEHLVLPNARAQIFASD